MAATGPVRLSPILNATTLLSNSSGLPLSGGKILIYKAGTTTPILAYTDNSGATAWSNPIILDSTGKVNGEVWLDTFYTGYKFVIQDSLGNGVITLDNIPTGTNVPVIPIQNVVNATSYVTAQANTGCGGTAHMTTGSPNLVIEPGAFVFNSSMVGSTIRVYGAFSTDTTIATYVSPTQVTTTANATGTVIQADFAVWNSGQDDTTGINATTAAVQFGQNEAYFPSRVYVFNSDLVNPAQLQAILGDGSYQTCFVSKTRSQTGNGWNISNQPANFSYSRFSVFGPGAVTPIHCTVSSLAAGVLTTTVDNAQVAPVGSVVRCLGARGSNKAFNYTYWKVSSSSSTQWVGTPVYWDGNTAQGTVSNVTVASNVATVLENNPYRRVNYKVTFYGLSSTAGLLLNGNTYTVASVIVSGGNVVGYTYTTAGIADQSATPDSGTATNIANTGFTDNFVAIPDFNGIRSVNNVLGGNVSNNGTHISLNMSTNDVRIHGFSGSGFHAFTPNCGELGGLSIISCNEGITLESTFQTTGWSSNPSAYGFRSGLEIQACTLYGIRIINAGGFFLSEPGIGGCGCGILYDGAFGVNQGSGDIEAMTPWAGDTTLFPGYNVEMRGNSRGVIVNGGYYSANSSAGQQYFYIWENCEDCIVIAPSFLLGGAQVEPTTQFTITSNCVGCAILNPRLRTGHPSNWVNQSQTSVVWVGGDYHFGGSTTNSVFVENVLAATNSVNQDSSLLTLRGQGWTGSATANVDVVQQTKLGTGSNPTVNWKVTTAGTSGNSTGTLVFPNGVFVQGSVLNLTNASGNAFGQIIGTNQAANTYQASSNSQQWTGGYNVSNAGYGVFDNTAGALRLLVADTTGLVTVAQSLSVGGNATLTASGASLTVNSSTGTLAIGASFQVDANKNVIVNKTGSTVATNATNGFFYVETCTGTPTGVPGTSVTGSIPMIYDATNNKLYVYNGAWKGVTLA